MSIYGDQIELEALINNCFDPETGEIKPEDDAAYQELSKELSTDGLERLAKVRANKMARLSGIDGEIKRLQALKKSETAHIDWLESYMLKVFELSPKDRSGKVITPTFTIGTRASSSVDVDESVFNDERFMMAEMVVKIDKMALKEALKNGEQIAGAFLRNNKNLTVK